MPFRTGEISLLTTLSFYLVKVSFLLALCDQIFDCKKFVYNSFKILYHAYFNGEVILYIVIRKSFLFQVAIITLRSSRSDC